YGEPIGVETLTK
nr:RecName: Full=Proteasome subunit alpha; AltName: Full=Multicatalytic endopeptidase complex subunit alpha [Halococcus dombrowskii]